MSNKRKLGSILGICGATVVAAGGSAFLTNTGMSILNQGQQITAQTETEEQKETELPITVEKFAKTKDSFVVSVNGAGTGENGENGESTSTQGGQNTAAAGENTMYSTGNVNIRSEAGSDSDVLGTLTPGESIEITGNTQDGWTEVTYNGQTGYISSNLLSGTSSSGSTSSGASASGGTSASGSSSSNSSSGSSSSASSGSSSGSTSSGSSSGGSTSSGSSWYTTPDSGTMYVTGDVNVRTGPGTGYNRIGGLSSGGTVEITGYTENGWIQVSYDGMTGYVAGNYLSWNKPSNNTGSTSSGSDDSYMMYDIDQRYISADELSGWSSSSLAKLRNEIFARHGRIFTTQTWIDYFATKSWYVPTYDAAYFDENMDSFLNDYEEANLKVILKLEG